MYYCKLLFHSLQHKCQTYPVLDAVSYTHLYSFPFSSSNLPDLLVESSYVLHAEEVQGENQTTLIPFDIFFPYGEHEASDDEDESDYSHDESREWASDDLNDQYNEWNHRFTFLRPYIEYEVMDAQSEEILDSNRGSDKEENSLSSLLSNYQENNVLDTDCDYAFLGAIGYGESGNITFTSFLSHEKTNTSQVLNKSAKSNPASEYDENYDYNKEFQKPQNRIYYFAMTTENLKALKSAPVSYTHLANSTGLQNNDGYYVDEKGCRQKYSNHSGGITGGMSDGCLLYTS